MSTLGKALKKARNEKKLSQKQVEELTGINFRTISSYEKDLIVPRPSNLKLLEVAYSQPMVLMIINSLERKDDLIRNKLVFDTHFDNLKNIANEIF